MECADDSGFSRPMPWVGLYVAVASSACSLAMAADALLCIKGKKLWFPCRFFSLNATSLTLLGIATKLPVDLNSSMPRRQDQLAKLSSIVLVCAAMGNLMPSLGSMGDSEMAVNLLALAIFVVTVVANVGIQMGTGVIFVFRPENAAVMVVMLLMLGILAASALAISATKQLLEEQYNQKHQLCLQEDDDGVGAGNIVKKLRRDVNKYWIMAHTCSPQCVLGRSALCSAAAILYLLATSILVEAWLRTQFDKAGSFCSGESDYKWSIVVILVSHVAAIAVGGIAPVCRWFNAIRFGAHAGEEKSSFNSELRVEAYWTQRLERWKEISFPYYFGTRKLRLIANLVQNRCLDLCIALQRTFVQACKLLLYISRLPFSCLFQILRKSRFDGSASSSQTHLSNFVLHLEGEENLVQLMTTKGCEATEEWINIGRKNRPMHLLNLLQKAPLSKGFRGVIDFDSVEAVSPIVGEDLPNCWALPLVTLTAIAMAVPATDTDELRLVKLLRAGVAQGLRYVKLVETNLNTRGPSSAPEAADVVWQSLDLYNKWLDVKLGQARPCKEAIKELVEEGKRRVVGFVRDGGGGPRIEPAQWPAAVLAANSMYRVGSTLLQVHREKVGKVGGMIRWAAAAAADVMGASLTNLPRVVEMECSCSAIEVREGSVGRAARLLGELEEVLEMVWDEGMDTDAMADIDAWRARGKSIVHDAGV